VIPGLDPTKRSGGEVRLADTLYIEDPASQRPLALMILQDHFADVEFQDVCHFSSYGHPEYRGDRWLFVDAKEAGQVQRIFYFVWFVDRKGGPVYGHRRGREVGLIWEDTIAVRNLKDEKVYHLEVPFPREAYRGLQSVRAAVLDTSGIEAQIGDDIELHRIQPEHSFVWPPNYGPKVINNRHLTFQSLKFDGEWKEAFPGALLITWEEFLRCYGAMQPDNWASHEVFMMNYDQKRKLILDAIRRKDLVPAKVLAMLGVGPVEDCMCKELMFDLEVLDLSAGDPEVRARLCETIWGIYVSSDEIQRRWEALVRRVATPEILQRLQLS